MRDDNDSRATVSHHRGRAAQALLTDDIEVRVRLIQDDKTPVAINRTGQRDTLLWPPEKTLTAGPDYNIVAFRERPE